MGKLLYACILSLDAPRSLSMAAHNELRRKNISIVCLVLLSRVVTSPKPHLGSHTFCRAPNQTQLGTPIHTTKPSTQATKHDSYDSVCYAHLQPNRPRCMISSGIVRVCTDSPSLLAEQGATNHAGSARPGLGPGSPVQYVAISSSLYESWKAKLCCSATVPAWL